MFRSLHMKLVLIMLLLITSLMAIVGAFLMTSITGFFIDDFYQQVTAIYNHDKKDIEFDCSALSFIDSTTLGTFVKIFKHLKQDGHTFALRHVQQRIKKLFQICALDTIMEID